ncbi:hypothetical protein JW868_02475 [Candidatus Woesearchaeota archaeon]|nr:hypothetical protein [Candidatus Woesearchaeota archaeon]
MQVINITKKQSRKRPLKISQTGLETEMHIIKDNGSLSYKGFDLCNKVKERYPFVNVEKECGKNMLELGCLPNINTYNPALEIIESIQAVINTGRGCKLRVYPFGTYPGRTKTKFTPSPDSKYKIQEKIFGKDKFALATKAVGFHHHYTLPKGVFDHEKKDLRLLMDSKLKRSLMNCYNFEIAIDPILTLLTQSSPFFEGQVLAKDSRLLVYRGGKKLNYPGMYNDHQQFGGLPPYKQTETDLIRSIKRRQARWEKLIRQADPNADPKTLYPCKLDISWNPVKINKLGTLEMRGMSMNYMSINLGLSALIKFCLKKIQREFIEVIPADKGINEPFKIKKGIMFIPPHTYVREELQKASAYQGFKDQALYEYTKKWYRFAKSLTPEFYYPILKKIEEMIDKRRSVSDEMLTFARRNKLLDNNGRLSKKGARIIALEFSERFEHDLVKTKRIVKQIMTVHTGNLVR